MAATHRRDLFDGRGDRYSHRITLRVQLALPRAIGCAAAKQFTTPSEYIRRSLLQALRADGIDPDKFISKRPTMK